MEEVSVPLWFWKKDLSAPNEDAGAWEQFDEKEARMIEAAKLSKMKMLTLNADYRINLKTMRRCRRGDKAERFNPIKRVANSVERSQSPPPKAQGDNRFQLRRGRCATFCYKSEILTKALFHMLPKKKKQEEQDYGSDNSASDYGASSPDEIMLDKILPHLPPDARAICYGDLVYFDDYRGVGLYAVVIKRGKLVLKKTGGEYGYELPRELQHIPRSYYEDDANIDRGYEDLDEELGINRDDNEAWDEDYTEK